MLIVIEYQIMENFMTVLEDRGNEVELGMPIRLRAAFKFLTILVVFVGLAVATEEGYLIGLLIASSGLWFWKVADLRRTIRFNQPPGYITVDYYRWNSVGAWSFLRDQKRLPLSKAHLKSGDVTYDVPVQTGPNSVTMMNYAELQLLDDNGDRFTLWHGNDLDTYDSLNSKITMAGWETE